MPTIEEIFRNALALTADEPPLEPSESRQPDLVRGVGELTDLADPPAQAKLADSESALVQKMPIVGDDPLIKQRSDTACFPVRITQTGGTGGTATTQASFTYTVASLQGATLGTSVSPDHPRPNGLMIAPSANQLAVGYYDQLGAIHFWSAGEVPSTATCPTA